MSALRFLLSTLLLLALLGLDIGSLYIFATGEVQFLVALQIHFATCLLAGIGLAIFLSSKFKTSLVRILLFVWTIAFFLPVLGLAGLIFAFLPGLLHSLKYKEPAIQFNKVRTFSEQPISKTLGFDYGLGNLENDLRSQNPDTRLAAVYATLKLDDKTAVPLLKLALGDPVDDIRLLAYALVDRKEHRISQRIQDAKRRIENSTAENNRFLYRSIAKDYWELAHLGLVEGETLNYVLDKAAEYLQAGLKEHPNDGGLHFHYGKLLLRQGKHAEAYDEFNMAELLGISPVKLGLYYSEIDFMQRRFQQLKHSMKDFILPNALPEIRATQRYWVEET